MKPNFQSARLGRDNLPSVQSYLIAKEQELLKDPITKLLLDKLETAAGTVSGFHALAVQLEFIDQHDNLVKILIKGSPLDYQAQLLLEAMNPAFARQVIIIRASREWFEAVLEEDGMLSLAAKIKAMKRYLNTQSKQIKQIPYGSAINRSLNDLAHALA